MIGALVALISLDVCEKLVASGVVYKTLNVIGATATSPIILETAVPHGLFASMAHAVVSGVSGVPQANGTWELVVIDDTHVSLQTYNHQGPLVQSSGTGAYVSGGTIQVALPGLRCRLGRQYFDVQDAPPRITFVPLNSPRFEFFANGGIPMVQTTDPSSLAQLTPEQQSMLLAPQIVTDAMRFRVRVWGGSIPASPDFADFDVAQALRNQVIESVHRLCAGMYEVLGSEWISQRDDATQLDRMGQSIDMILEIKQPVTAAPLAFVPPGTFASITVEPVNPGAGDQITITTPPVS